jgi:[acyl-carrier-protein] S-malonyltransferase
MAKARDDFKKVLDATPFASPTGIMLFNVTADAESDPLKIKKIMSHQICRPVLWYQIIQKMLAQGVDLFVEVGPKKVLQDLLGKIAPQGHAYQVFGVEDPITLQQFLSNWPYP